MKKVRLIGDIHGDWNFYKDFLLLPTTPSIQVGDFGYGFNHPKDELMLDWQKENLQHKFIRGNHDDKCQCLRSESYIPDGFWDKQNNIMYVGGAWSIDYGMRVEGVDWWEDEECSTDTFKTIYNTYVEVKPRIMITHDAPLQIPRWTGLLQKGEFQMVTRTGLWLERMLRAHRPDLWVFGHWHKSVDKTLEGTRFVCLNINETKDLDLDTLELT